MLYESATGYNMFKTLGGIKDSPVVREGAFRCQGAFRISITAGIFGATLVPVFAGLYMAKIQRARAAVGIIAGLIITFTFKLQWPVDGLDERGCGSWFLAFACKYEDGAMGRRRCLLEPERADERPGLLLDCEI